MKIKLILPALAEATSPLFRPIKYSLFPPLGLATPAEIEWLPPGRHLHFPARPPVRRPPLYDDALRRDERHGPWQPAGTGDAV